MSWNHRIFKHSTPAGDFYTLREAYYNKEGEIWGYSQQPTFPCGENLEELKSCLELMLRDVDRFRDAPFLTEDMEFAKQPNIEELEDTYKRVLEEEGYVEGE